MCAGSRIDRFSTRTRGPTSCSWFSTTSMTGSARCRAIRRRTHPQWTASHAAGSPSRTRTCRRRSAIRRVQAFLRDSGRRPQASMGWRRAFAQCPRLPGGSPCPSISPRTDMPPRRSARSSMTGRFHRDSVNANSRDGGHHHQCRCPRSAWHHRPARPAKWRGSWTGGSSPNGEPPRLSRRTTRATTPCGRIAGHAEARRERRTRSGSRGGAERAVPLVSWFLRSLVPSFPTCLSPPQNLHLRDARRIARSATCAPPHFGRWAFSAWPRSCEA
jgi:hypothetical protein